MAEGGCCISTLHKVPLILISYLPTKPNSKPTARCHGATGYRYAQFLRAANVGVGLGVEPVASLRDDVAFLIFRVLRVAHLAKDATRKTTEIRLLINFYRQKHRVKTVVIINLIISAVNILCGMQIFLEGGNFRFTFEHSSGSGLRLVVTAHNAYHIWKNLLSSFLDLEIPSVVRHNQT